MEPDREPGAESQVASGARRLSGPAFGRPSGLRLVGRYALLLLVSFVVLFPVYTTVIAALKPGHRVLKNPLVPDSFTLDIALDALETEGKGRILSAPKIQPANNEEAEIEQGVRIPIVNTTATEINVEFISASLKLEVTPQITAEGTIIMDIDVDNSSPDFDNTVGGTPSINTERASTRVLVEDGGTTVIGGVFLLQEGESETGVPGLRKVPGLGWLFKRKNITKQNRELLIFITPKIMS